MAEIKQHTNGLDGLSLDAYQDQDHIEHRVDTRFQNLDALRLESDFADLVGVQKATVSISCRKPRADEFIRVHHDRAFWFKTALVQDKEAREFYLIVGQMRALFPHEAKPVQLALSITRSGTLFFWPLFLADARGRWNTWHKTSYLAAERATDRWVRIFAAVSDYEVLEAAPGVIPDPTWPEDMSLSKLLALAFGDDHLIDSVDHPFLRRLQGRE